MKTGLILQQQLNLNLSPQMLLLRDLIQMDSVELEQYVQTAASENPFLRFEPLHEKDLFAHSVYPPEPSESFMEKEDTGDAVSHLPDPDGPDLYAVLHADADRLPCSATDKTALHCLISCLEKNGRLETPLETISALSHIPLSRLDRALSLLWHMDPVGMGARSLSECLSIQIKHLYPDDTLAAAVIESHLPDLAQEHFSKLSEEYHAAPARFREILDRVRLLDPFPLPVPLPEEPIRYIREDLTAVRTADGIRLVLCGDLSERLDLDPDYLVLLDSVPKGPDKQWMLEKKQAATDLISHIRTRGQLLLETAAYLTGIQSDHLTDPSSPLKPLTLTQASRELGLHVSLLSRLASGKYLRFGTRLIPLRTLFIREIHSGEKAFSAPQIRLCLSRIIESEPPDAPYTDLRLCEELKKIGITIARRTVAKYRKELGIDIPGRRKRAADAPAVSVDSSCRSPYTP